MQYLPGVAPRVAYVTKRVGAPKVAIVAYGVASSSAACQAAGTGLQSAGIPVVYLTRHYSGGRAMSWRDSKRWTPRSLVKDRAVPKSWLSTKTRRNEVMKIVLGGEADAGQHLLAVSSGSMGAPPGQCLGHGRRVGRLIAPGGLQDGMCRLDGNQGLGQPMAHGLEVADGPVELDASQGMHPGHFEHLAGRPH